VLASYDTYSKKAFIQPREKARIKGTDLPRHPRACLERARERFRGCNNWFWCCWCAKYGLVYAGIPGAKGKVFQTVLGGAERACKNVQEEAPIGFGLALE
jgi:hypothetical protein